MPWCRDCERYLTVPTVRPDGTCPSCGRSVAQADSAVAKAPWHFKLLVAAAAAYLAMRGAQGVGWVVEQLR